jgi:uncharacterized protein YcnI
MKKFTAVMFTVYGLLFTYQASAHVVVRPSQVGVGLRQVFTVSVPNEKDNPVIALKVLIPDGVVSSVTPNVKPGWKIEIKTHATGKKITDEDGLQIDEKKPVEIDWTGGSIPAGQRDEFYFQTQVPSSETSLNWKAYQTYADGTVVAWDQTPGNDAKTPYSVTRIVNDLTAGSSPNAPVKSDSKSTTALSLSIAALVLAIFALSRKKPSPPQA